MCLVLALCGRGLSAVEIEFDFGLAPRLNRTVETFVASTIRYNDMWFSSVSLEYKTDEDEQIEAGENLTITETRHSRSFEGSVEAIGLNVVRNPFDLGISVRATYLFFDADEVIRYDADEGFELSPGVDSQSIDQQRRLHVFLPMAGVRFEYRTTGTRFRFSGEYSPAVTVQLDQTVDSTPGIEGFNDDGPVRSAGTYRSGQAFGSDVDLRVDWTWIAPRLALGYTHLPIEYEIAQPGGSARIETLIRSLNIDLEFALRAVSFLGFNPSARMRLERDWTEIAGQPDIVESDTFRLFFGVTRF